MLKPALLIGAGLALGYAVEPVSLANALDAAARIGALWGVTMGALWLLK